MAVVAFVFVATAAVVVAALCKANEIKSGLKSHLFNPNMSALLAKRRARVELIQDAVAFSHLKTF